MTTDSKLASKELFYVVSVRHTERRDRFITFWRPNNAGYAYPLSWSGKYARETVEAMPGYYNNGWDTITVPCAVVDAIAVPTPPNCVDNDAGPVVMNNARNWKVLLEGVIAKPKNKPCPQYKGARREQCLAI